MDDSHLSCEAFLWVSVSHGFSALDGLSVITFNFPLEQSTEMANFKVWKKNLTSPVRDLFSNIK